MRGLGLTVVDVEDGDLLEAFLLLEEHGRDGRIREEAVPACEAAVGVMARWSAAPVRSGERLDD